MVSFNLLHPFKKLSLCFHVCFDFAMHHGSLYCPFKDSEKMITYVIKTFCAVNETKTEINIYIYIYIYIHIFPKIPYFGLCYFPFDSTQFVRFLLRNFGQLLHFSTIFENSSPERCFVFSHNTLNSYNCRWQSILTL